MDEDIAFKGKFFEIVQIAGRDGKLIEIARRAPGVRTVIADKPARRLLLTREFRRELNDWDYRLPGGKVFDSLAAYEDFRASGKDILAVAANQAMVESREEGGIDVQATDFIKKSVCGASVEWDLYVFEATQWRPHAAGQQLEAGEQVETDNWFSYAEVERMILDGKMQEERIALILLQWLHRQQEANAETGEDA